MLNIKLSASLNDNTVFLERIHMLESRNEELMSKFKEVKEEYDVTLSHLNISVEKSDVPAIKESISKLATIQEHLGNINSEQIQAMKELRKHETENYRSSGGDETNSETEINEKQDTHTAQQIALNSELQEVMKKLSMKERLAEYLSEHEFTVDYGIITDCEKKITNLELEKHELLQQLKNVQSTGPCAKIAEQRRKRVQELENQIQDLNKKVCTQIWFFMPD